jgi:hypothetical protein
MSGYISFRRFITPAFIMAIYILGAIVITILSIILMIGGFNTTAVPGQFSLSGDVAVVLGIILLVFGNLFWRILCEYMVVQFRIYDELVSLNRRMGSQAPTTQIPPQASATPICPTCGGPLRYIQQYQRWYCDREQKYV